MFWYQEYLHRKISIDIHLADFLHFREKNRAFSFAFSQFKRGLTGKDLKLPRNCLKPARKQNCHPLTPVKSYKTS